MLYLFKMLYSMPNADVYYDIHFDIFDKNKFFSKNVLTREIESDIITTLPQKTAKKSIEPGQKFFKRNFKKGIDKVEEM